MRLVATSLVFLLIGPCFANAEAKFDLEKEKTYLACAGKYEGLASYFVNTKRELSLKATNRADTIKAALGYFEEVPKEKDARTRHIIRSANLAIESGQVVEMLRRTQHAYDTENIEQHTRYKKLYRQLIVGVMDCWHEFNLDQRND